MARKADKSYYLKKLFEQQLVRTNPEASSSQRQDEAAKFMDHLVGPRWREEVNAEMELVPDLEEIPNSQEIEEFWGKVQQAGVEAGFGTEDVTHDEPQDQPDPKCAKVITVTDPKIVAKIKSLLGLGKKDG